MIERTDKYSIFIIRDKKDRFENVKFMSNLNMIFLGKCQISLQSDIRSASQRIFEGHADFIALH